MDRTKILTWLLYVASAIVLIVIVFFLTMWILNKMTEPGPEAGEYPNSPISVNFPEAPKTIKITELYFNGPYPLRERNVIAASIFSILCKKEGSYDIIYIGDTGEGYQLSANPNAKCWVENCDGELTIANFWAPATKYKIEDIRKLRILLEVVNTPVCSTLEL